MKSFLSFVIVMFCGITMVLAGRTEQERVAAYHARNYTWPLEYTVPNTPGWKRLQQHRMNQVAEIADRSKRFEGWAQTMQIAAVAPNFTEYGFALARAPDDLMEDRREAIRQGLEKGPRTEKQIDVIDTAEPSWFIDRPDLTKRVLHEMQPYVETWSNTELKAWGAYGFRLYRNSSKLLMHVDRTQSHVVSFILHIGSSENAEPWPIVIEDLHGITHEVVLTSGDMLLYESSKCLHGRPRRLNGSWYTSVFAHYYPKFGWEEINHADEKVFAIPPHWIEPPTTQFEIPLEMVGTGMTEPSCPDGWCQLKYSKKWSGPGKAGYLITPAGEEVPFEPKRVYSHQANPRETS